MARRNIDLKKYVRQEGWIDHKKMKQRSKNYKSIDEGKDIW